MSAKRIGLEEASRICGAEITLFANTPKVPIRAGQYYAIIANSPDVGVAISDEPIEGFTRVNRDYRIGKACDIATSAAAFFV